MEILSPVFSLGCPVEDAYLFLLFVGGSNGIVLFDLWRSVLPWFSLFPFYGGDRVEPVRLASCFV